MDASYAIRKSQLLDECQVAPAIFEQVIPRLDTFMEPFVPIFQGQAADQHAQTSIGGLLSDVERKNIASIAYRFGQSRLPLQRFIGWAPWEDVPFRQELTRQVAEHLGHADGVLVFEQHLDSLRRKDSLRGAETTEISVRLENYFASHFEGSAFDPSGFPK